MAPAQQANPAKVVVYNVGTTPVTLDDGRQVEARSWAAVEESEVEAHVDAGHLVVIDVPTDTDADLDPEARKALREAGLLPTAKAAPAAKPE